MSPATAEVIVDLPGDPRARLASRRRIVAFAVFALLLDCLRVELSRIPLPFDAVNQALLFMFFPVNGLGQYVSRSVAFVVDLACILVPVVLLAAGLSPWTVPSGVVTHLRRWALALPILNFIASDLHRWVENAGAAGSRWVSFDLTPAIARVEGPLVDAVQRYLGNPGLTHVSGIVYSTVWITALIAAPLIIMAGRQPDAGREVLIAYFLMPVLALPCFLLMPVFEPWATNPAYGHVGPALTQVRFMAPAPVDALTRVATEFRWATGSCLPSLHVVAPCIVSWLAARRGLHRLAWSYGAFAVITGFVIVYLGRHWVVDAIAAVPFTLGLQWVTRRADAWLAASRVTRLLRA